MTVYVHMSLSLVVFRLEVADSCADIPNIYYEAQNFQPNRDFHKPSYAEVVSPALVRVGRDGVLQHQGRRSFQRLTIESHTSTDPNLEENEKMADSASQGKAANSSTGASVSFSDTKTAPTGGSARAEGVKLAASYSKAAATVTGQKPLPPKLKKSRKKSKEEPVREAQTRDGNEHTSDRHHAPPGGSTDSGDNVLERDATASIPEAPGRREPTLSEAMTSKRKSKSPSPLSMFGCAELGSEEEGPASRPNSAKGRGRATIPPAIAYFSGNPAVETTEGIIHLYKETESAASDEALTSRVICMLSMPAAMNSQDVLQFVAPVAPWIENLKIIRDGTPNQYMVLLKFRSQKYSDEFYKNFDSKPFNSIESDICHLVYVAKVETVKASEGAGLPVTGLTELPVCPVCLERMDESVSGILTILCNHSFHGSCLAQWGDTSCPVCRYVQTPEALADNKCFGCEAKENLWICLICGHVGCGRYDGGHAYRHFQDTNHTYSMQLDTSRVWDYAGDNYVHRLVQSKGDGKMVEVDEGGRLMENEKLDSITLEYTYLLTSQLESQRHYFEEKIEHVEKEGLKQVEESETRSKAALEECSRLERQLATVTKEKSTTDKKCMQFSTKLSKLQKDLQEEQELNKGLQQNQHQWQAKVGELQQQMLQKDQEVKDLQEQLRDVMFYLEAQQKLATTTAATQDEIQESQIVMGQQSNSPGGSSGGGVTKRGRKKGR